VYLTLDWKNGSDDASEDRLALREQERLKLIQPQRIVLRNFAE